MPSYRLYFVGPDGHFEGVEVFVSEDDDAATLTAQQHPDPRAKELWRLGDRIEGFPASALERQPPPIAMGRRKA